MNAEAETTSRQRWLALLAAFLGWMFDGLEQGLVPLAGRPALRELLAPAAVGGNLEELVGVWFGRTIALFLVGAALGGVTFGWLGDRIGRVRAMALSVFVYSIFSGMCAFASTPIAFAGMRFVASVGMGGEWALGVALVMEVWPSNKRPLMAALIGMSSNIGFLIVGMLGLGLAGFIGSVGGALGTFLPQDWVATLVKSGGWRLLFLMGAVPAVLTFAIRVFVPESEQWKRASRDAPKTRVADIFAAGVRGQTFRGLGLAALALMGTWGSVQWIPAWTAKITEKPALTATAAICIAIGASIGSFSMALLAQKFTRRSTYFCLCLASLAVCQVVFRMVPHDGSDFWILVVLSGVTTSGFYGWLPLYLPELFPTRLRATATGFSYNGGRIAAAAGTLGSGAMVAAFGGNYAKMGATITLIYLLGPLLIFISPETKGRPLPELTPVSAPAKRTVVVGAGVIGLGCAYALAKRGREVIIVDKGKPGAACSKGNAGWVTPSLSAPIAAPGLTWTSLKWMLRSDSPFYIAPSAAPRLARWLWRFWRHCNAADFERGLHLVSELNRNTLAHYDQLQKEGLSFELHRQGLLFAFHKDKYLRGVLDSFSHFPRYGYEIPKALDGNEARALEPALSDHVTGGLYVKEEYHVRPETLAAAYVDKLAAMQVAIHAGTITGPLREGERVVGIQTDTGPVQGDEILVAAGAWSGEVLNTFGVSLPVQAGKGYSITLAQGGPALSLPTYLGEARIGCTPFAGGIRFAGTMELSGVNTNLDRRRLVGIRNGVAQYFNTTLADGAGEEWVGLRPISPDGLPMLGRVPGFENVFLATGHAMLGVTLAPVTGEAMAELIAGAGGGDALSAFDPNRFRW